VELTDQRRNKALPCFSLINMPSYLMPKALVPHPVIPYQSMLVIFRLLTIYLRDEALATTLFFLPIKLDSKIGQIFSILLLIYKRNFLFTKN